MRAFGQISGVYQYLTVQFGFSISIQRYGFAAVDSVSQFAAGGFGVAGDDGTVSVKTEGNGRTGGGGSLYIGLISAALAGVAVPGAGILELVVGGGAQCSGVAVGHYTGVDALDGAVFVVIEGSAVFAGDDKGGDGTLCQLNRQHIAGNGQRVDQLAALAVGGAVHFRLDCAGECTQIQILRLGCAAVIGYDNQLVAVGRNSSNHIVVADIDHGVSGFQILAVLHQGVELLADMPGTGAGNPVQLFAVFVQQIVVITGNGLVVSLVNGMNQAPVLVPFQQLIFAVHNLPVNPGGGLQGFQVFLNGVGKSEGSGSLHGFRIVRSAAVTDFAHPQAFVIGSGQIAEHLTVVGAVCMGADHRHGFFHVAFQFVEGIDSMVHAGFVGTGNLNMIQTQVCQCIQGFPIDQALFFAGIKVAAFLFGAVSCPVVGIRFINGLNVVDVVAVVFIKMVVQPLGNLCQILGKVIILVVPQVVVVGVDSTGSAAADSHIIGRRVGEHFVDDIVPPFVGLLQEPDLVGIGCGIQFSICGSFPAGDSGFAAFDVVMGGVIAAADVITDDVHVQVFGGIDQFCDVFPVRTAIAVVVLCPAADDVGEPGQRGAPALQRLVPDGGVNGNCGNSCFFRGRRDRRKGRSGGTGNNSSCQYAGNSFFQVHLLQLLFEK